jgi:endonuclease/exonuclease/phosphatase family metal-dependent hydrolase
MRYFTAIDPVVIIYNTERIELLSGSVYTVDDPQDLLHREPLVARFRVRGPPPEKAFTFTLVDIHTDPDETATELDVLADVFAGVQQNGSGEDDVILLGDLNVDEHHLGRLGKLPNIAHAISGTPTNTHRDRTYDNIVFDRQATVEFTGRAGVLDLRSEYGLSEQQALEVSDHLPVWAEFDVYESTVSGAVP